ncbi:MAG: chemotaxis protein CheB [Pseudomonadota bacterium]
MKKTNAKAAAFPIAGIGASAGGLEALEQFFQGVPADSGLAYIVVQHLDPTHKDLLVELLQRAMAMPVLQAAENQLVLPNHVYVIPPNCDLALRHGRLHLQAPAAPRGLRLPIDFFLRTLADECKGSAVAVILSGMGSDGTLGLGAVKEQGGAVFVQEPASAKFDGMPRSAIATGLADLVGPAAKLGAAILACTGQQPRLPAPAMARAGVPDLPLLEQVIELLRRHCGHDFSQYKTSTLQRRIERRMALHQVAQLADYVAYLRANPHEAGLLFKELLIGVTSFFRDPAVWEQVQSEVLPALLAAHPEGAALRAWVPACSTGEEAYTLAMLFLDVLDSVRPSARYTLQIFATDLDSDAIDRARAGVYPANFAACVSEARLQRYFVQDGDSYRVSKAVREMVIFAPQNVVMDPPFTKLDLLTCRNLLIYLEANLQKKLLPLFHFSLREGGYLVLGSAETLGASANLFHALPGKTRIYQRRNVALRTEPVEFPAARYGRARGALQESPLSQPSAPSTVPNIQALTDALLLQTFAPAAVLVTDQGDIVYFSGKTGKYLEPAAGKANLNIFAMAREGLSGALNEVFARVVRERASHTLNDVRVGQDGSSVLLNVTLQYVSEPAALQGMVLVAFHELAGSTPVRYAGVLPQAQAERMAAMAEEVQQARAQLQKAREDMHKGHGGM